MKLEQNYQSALGKEWTRHKKELIMCVITYNKIIRVLIVEEVQRLAEKGRSSAREVREFGIVLARNTTTSA